MFFLMSIYSKQKQLDFHQTIVCEKCGQYGRYEVFMTYTVFSLFFIPLFKWNKKYYVQTSCCQTTYELIQEIGRKIERQEPVVIQPSNIRQISKDNICSNCGYPIHPDYTYCPKCGQKL